MSGVLAVVRLSAVVLLFGLGLAASAVSASPPKPTTSLPVISVPSQCTSLCGLPSSLTPACMQCMYSNGALNSWSSVPEIATATCARAATEPAFSWACMVLLRNLYQGNLTVEHLLQPPPLQRLPLYELGYTHMAALPLLNPKRFTEPLLHPETMEISERALSTNFQYGPSNITVCYPDGSKTQCASRPAGSTLGTLNVHGVDITLDCIKSQGWLSPSGANTPACPLKPLTATNVALNSPEQLAMMYPSTRNRQVYMPTAQSQARAFLTDLTAAQDSLWSIAHNVYSSTMYFKNVTTATRVARLKAMYSSNWDAAWSVWATQGKLVELDLTYMSQFVPVSTFSGVNVAAHALLEYRGSPSDSSVLLRTVAVALGNNPKGPTSNSSKLTVYTPKLSTSAFILAMAMVRSAYTHQVIWAGHAYHFHTVQGAIMYALYNTMDPTTPVGLSSHPVRQLLDPYLDPTYLLEFMAALFGGSLSPPPTPTTPADLTTLLQFMELYAKAGPLSPATMHAVHPLQQLNISGLSASRFTSPKGSAWDQYPLADLLLKILKLCNKVATDTLSQYYSSDAAVASDAGIQAWVAAMLSTKGGNLGRINAANRVTTRLELYELAGYVLFTTVAHATSHLQDYTLRTLSMAHMPPLLNTTSLPNPTARYTTAQMVATITNTDTYGRQANFIFAFTGSKPWTQFVPGTIDWDTGATSPEWEGDLPFTGASFAGMAKANAAIVAFRKAVSSLLSDTKQSPLIRMAGTNWGSPLVLNRVLDM